MESRFGGWVVSFDWQMEALKPSLSRHQIKRFIKHLVTSELESKNGDSREKSQQTNVSFRFTFSRQISVQNLQTSLPKYQNIINNK